MAYDEPSDRFANSTDVSFGVDAAFPPDPERYPSYCTVQLGTKSSEAKFRAYDRVGPKHNQVEEVTWIYVKVPIIVCLTASWAEVLQRKPQ
jgi:hypothetical protein